MRRIKILALSFALVVGIAATANASSISYTVDIGGGAINGAVTHVAILETGGGLTNIDFGYSLNATGQTTLTHDVPFVPTSSLIVGLDLPGAVDNVSHIVFFTNPTFAWDANGRLFSVVFPNSHHNDFVNRLLSAEGGDAANRAWLLNFFATDGAPAAFAPGAPTMGIEFTVGTVITPEPSTFVLFGLGLAIAAGRRLRRA
jgi:hypothetical protein